ncbi:hypothetical protein FE782_25335 [Paenibacillus antri]|uniref:Uncharacterized protein n=1 Tax=Paenibacillus antri TaxID=2582848 RepID=A0A5R9G0Y6_9BACL|nr:hypothetical protein [Paenibacillus antri]TLS49441.1 hypothetical protein FE782_25335 [Paenibacillus antri]
MAARLEYRLADAAGGHPLLYVYNRIDKDEISLRFACDYFVKDGVVYEKLSAALQRGLYVVYVRSATEENAAVPDATGAIALGGGIRVEFREYAEEAETYPLLHTFRYADDDDALLLLQSDAVDWNGFSWNRSSTEVDEDRGVYVYYATRSTEG